MAFSDPPEVTVLLLGDEGVGMSTFLARLTSGNARKRTALSTAPLSAASVDKTPLPTLRDLDQPFTFDITPRARQLIPTASSGSTTSLSSTAPLVSSPSSPRTITPTATQSAGLRLLFHDTASTHPHYTSLHPDVIILCFDIRRRHTLHSVRTRWKEVVETRFNARENLPVILLGLKRDLRVAELSEQQRCAVLDAGAGVVPCVSLSSSTTADAQRSDSGYGGGDAAAGVEGAYECNGSEDDVERELRRGGMVMPQEGLAVAQAMRLDRYAECSALTGELCGEVFEDLARTAAMTTSKVGGGRSEGANCAVM